jgi:hypothetical protein
VTKEDILIVKAGAKSLEFFVKVILKAKPTKQQMMVIRDIDKGKRKISIRSGHGCFAAGHPVMMFDGTIKPVEDVRVGDLLMGDDGTPRCVLQLKRGREEMYRFTFNSGDVHTYNASHKLVLVATQSHGKQKTGDVVEVTVREWLSWSDRKKRTHAAMKRGVQFAHKELPIDPYLLGVWLGDGATINGSITLSDRDAAEILDGYDIVSIKEENGACKRYRIQGLQRKLRSMGMIGNKHIPHDYKTTSEEQRLNLLAGIVDTDGYLDNRKKSAQYEIVQKSKRLSDDIVFLARSLGIHATIRKVSKTCTNTGATGEYYLINLSRGAHRIPVRTSHKRPTDYAIQRENLHFGIRSVEPLGIGDYYGFTLNGNHRFLSGDFIVTRNTGKTTLLAWIVLWWGLGREDAKIPMTAPTGHQLYDLLMPEIRKWREKMPLQYQNEVDVKTEKIDYANGNFAVPRTARKDQPEALQGFHATNLAFIIDEASGIPQVIFEVAEGAMTGESTLVIMAANPTRTEGYFYDSHHKNRWQWSCYQFNAEESENVSKQWIEEKKRQYGEDSDVYRVRVKGEFPRQSSNAVFSLQEVEDAISREVFDDSGAEVWGLDVADFGDDKSVLAKRKGKHFHEITKRSGLTLPDLAGWLIYEYNNSKRKPAIIFVDAIGIGSSLPAVCFEKGLDIVVGVKGSNAASDSEKYHNKRAEWYYNLKELLEDGKIPDDDELVGELMAQKYQISSTGKIQLVEKKEIKRELGRSPDSSDACAMTCERMIYIEDGAEDIPEADMMDVTETYGLGGAAW